MVTNMDADAQVPALYVEEIDRAAAAAEDPHLLVSATLATVPKATAQEPTILCHIRLTDRGSVPGRWAGSEVQGK